MTNFDALIARLEVATEGSAGLDAEIAEVVGWKHNASPNPNNPWHWKAPDGQGYVHPPFFSRSLDAALTLVPEGWTVARINENDDKTWACELREGYLTSYTHVVFGGEKHKDATAALALCIAALKVRKAE